MNLPLDKEAIFKLLQSHDIQATQQRIEIAQIMFSRPQHLSAEQVLEEVNKSGALVSKATVYNTLGLFTRQRLIREIIVDPSRVFYDSNTSDHHHYYNTDTGILTDITDGEIKFDQLPKLPDNMVSEGVDVIIRVRSSQ